MDIDGLLTTCVGFDDDGDQVRFYLDSPEPTPSVTREAGVRTPLFHLFGGGEAGAIRRHLACRPCWEVLRVPPDYTAERGAAAVRVAARWHAGRPSPLFLFAAARRVRDERHRGELRRVVGHLIDSVIENPVNARQFADLTLLREVIDTAPLAADLAPEADRGAGQLSPASTKGVSP